jgi:GT2 family glycosyltransferase
VGVTELSVAVVIVSWNSGISLGNCLACLDKQSYPPTRILVMDNGSTDGSGDLVRGFPGVTVQRLGNNFGFAAANNKAVLECDTEYVALLNADAFPEKDWLHRLMASAQEFSDVAMFGSRQMMYSEPGRIDGIGDIYHFSGLVWRNGYSRRLRDGDLVSREIFSPCAGAALYRRDAFLEVGGFDEDYFCYVEDVDLGFRLRLRGHCCVSVPDAVVYHVGSVSSGGRHSDFAVYHGHRNLVWTFVKNMPGVLFWLLLPAHVLLNIVSVVYFAVLGQFKVILRAKLDGLKEIPRMLRKRRRIQADRRVAVADIWRILDKRLMPFRGRESWAGRIRKRNCLRS